MIVSSFGKPYNNEPAIISLTSWTARINTVGLTIYSLAKNCPGFHIILCLAVDEFPNKEHNLPKSLLLLAARNIVEILWVEKNIKSFKKIFPAMSKYSKIPIISADDDCFYNCNYAQELYNTWSNHKNANIAFTKSTAIPPFLGGPCTLYTPLYYPIWLYEFKKYHGGYLHDDSFIRMTAAKAGMRLISLHDYWPFKFHDEINPINGSMNNPQWDKYLHGPNNQLD